MSMATCSKLLVGDSDRSRCMDICKSEGLECDNRWIHRYSCEEAAQVACNNREMRELSFHPEDVSCHFGGGCFVNCHSYVYFEIARWNATCGENYCLFRTPMRILCPCKERAAVPEPAVIHYTTEETAGVSIFYITVCLFGIYLICCCCSASLVKRSNFAGATQEEMEAFLQEELNSPVRQLYWCLCCEPIQHYLVVCFKKTKKCFRRACRACGGYISGYCRRSQENVSSLGESSHALIEMEEADRSSRGTRKKPSKDRRSRDKSRKKLRGKESIPIAPSIEECAKQDISSIESPVESGDSTKSGATGSSRPVTREDITTLAALYSTKNSKRRSVPTSSLD